MTHEELKECIGEYRELKKDLWWANCWGVQKIDGYNFGVHYNDFAGHWQFSWNDPENEHRVADTEDIFDNQEECEEYWEFGNITRMEKLELPTLKQIQHNTIGWVKYFKGADNNDYALKVDFMCDTISIINTNKLEAIKEYNHISRPAFLSAKRLCVKLFRGESV